MNEKIFNRNFSIIFIGKLLSQMGDQVYLFSVIWYITSTTGKPLYVALFTIIGVVPVILLSLFGGVISDRFDRKKIMIIIDLSRGIMLFIFTYMTFKYSNLVFLFLIAFFLGVSDSFYDPANSALIPHVVSERNLLRANSIIGIVTGISTIVAIYLAAKLYEMLGLEFVLIINGLSFILSGILEIFLKFETTNKTKVSKDGKTFFNEIKESFTYIKCKYELYNTFIFFIIVNLLMAPLATVYMPFMIKFTLNSGPVELSHLQISYGVGYLILSIIFAVLIRNQNYLKNILKAIFIEGISLLCIGVLLNPIVLKNNTVNKTILFCMILAFVLGIAVALVNTNIQSFFQNNVDDIFRGRVLSMLNIFLRISLPFGLMIGAILIKFFNIYLIMLLTSINLIIITFIFSKIIQKNK